MDVPIYKKIFTRDFTLASVEIWVRPETIGQKIWTTEKQPYLPYIIGERAEGIVNAFYDPRGITWMKQLLIKHIKNDEEFLKRISSEYKHAYQILKEIYSKKTILSREELVRFLSQAEHFWVWFEALWWVWELTPEEQVDVKIPFEIFTLRENTQEIMPEIERITRNTLYNLYPDLGDLIEVLTVDEIENESLPNKSILEDRHKGYYFVNNTLIVGENREYIEGIYKLQFERYLIDTKDEVKGQVGFAGVARGIVKIVYSPKQITKVNNGDIIVSSMTMPEILPAMKIASAFVTDEGGIMCHAAIIAREMKKPCIIGTKYATKILKDGDLVEVDANKGIVKILRRIN